MFKVGQRVRVKNIKYAGGRFNGCIGVITKVDERLPYPYRVRFNSSVMNKVSGCHFNSVFEGRELCLYKPTDIMEYLKHMLLEKD